MIELSNDEARVIGCLIEKSVVTPEQYPLTLNALTAACNQKSSRDPVMSLEQGAVQRIARDLENKNLLRIDEPPGGRAERYVQRFCNTRYSDFQFDPAQLAVVCLLLLRGAQTPGELRARSGRLHSFSDNQSVVETLRALTNWEGGPLVAQLPRKPGRRDSEYVHLFCGPVVESVPPAAQAPALPAESNDLAARVARLEQEVASLRALLERTPDDPTD